MTLENIAAMVRKAIIDKIGSVFMCYCYRKVAGQELHVGQWHNTKPSGQEHSKKPIYKKKGREKI